MSENKDKIYKEEMITDESEYDLPSYTVTDYLAMNDDRKSALNQTVREKHKNVLDAIFADETVAWVLLTAESGKIVKSGGKSNHLTDQQIAALEADAGEVCVLFSQNENLNR